MGSNPVEAPKTFFGLTCDCLNRNHNCDYHTFISFDTKLMVNLELQEKFTRSKKPESFMIMRAKISAGESIGGAALINFFIPDAALIRGPHLIEGGAYSSKYGTWSLLWSDIWNVSYIELRIFKSAVQYMKYFIYHFTSILHGLIRTHKWPAANVSGFIAQLVRASHRYREVTGSNPVEVLTFSGFYKQLFKLRS